MGRPIIYKDDEYNWNDQGQLTSILTQDGDEIEYYYDINGIRRKKIVNGVETTYITNGSQILIIKQGNETIYFRYGLNKVIGFNYNNGSSSKEYIYQRNIQGDIISIYDDKGNEVGGYSYDAYGNVIITKDTDGIATLNPFRYRGYYYDNETDLYYLNSRYYDPDTGRFISPDILSILDETRSHINGLNLYMYCKNNPVMFVDENGQLFVSFLIGFFAGAIIGGLYGGISAAANGQDVLAGILIGVVAGGLLGGFSGMAAYLMGPLLGTTVEVLSKALAIKKFIIGITIVIAPSFIIGFVADIFSQLSNNGWDRDNLNFESAVWTGIEWALINTLNALTCGLVGKVVPIIEALADALLGMLYSGIGAIIDILRYHIPKSLEERKNEKNVRLLLEA